MLSFSVTAICLPLSQKRCRQPRAPAPKDLRAPKSYCGSNGFKCVGKTGIFPKLSLEERNITCGDASKDVDCPTGGCVGFSVKFLAGLEANGRRPR
jgi:hypothetical protein